jgi:ubiquinone/menaquinone biosynthesis C-methylase UbiE
MRPEQEEGSPPSGKTQGKTMKSESPVHARLSTRHEAEILLRTHPGVQEAVVVAWRNENSTEEIPLAYVVPRDDYIGRILAGEEWDRKRIQKWRKTFDLSQLGKQVEPSEPDFNIAGWNSSYTRQPIPAEQMREWVEVTVEELKSFHPQEVLEIGCGSGLLLLRLARGCARYVGTDVSGTVLKKLRKQMEELGGEWSKVTLLERSAENLDGFAECSIDTAILNSVVKYFPNDSYLLSVLEGAIRLVKPGGRIFVGDVRNLVLLEPCAVSVELHQAQPSMGLEELRERVNHRIQFEEQLVISPAFFLALRKRFPRITGVEVHPKRGRFDNEMTRFRFQAILQVETHRQEQLDVSFLDWNEQRLSQDSIAGLLQHEKPKTLAMKNVANSRIEKDVESLKELSRGETSGTVGEFKRLVDERERQGIDPQWMWTLGAEFGYQVDISWAACRPDGSYDVVFRKVDDNHELLRRTIAWPQPQIDTEKVSQYANIPGRGILHSELIKQLLDYCRQTLPQDSTPTEVIIMDALPLTTDGIVDIEKLRPPDTQPR